MGLLLKPNRCDQCAKRGLGCSREIPSCTSCLHLQINCEYTRVLKIQRRIKPEVEKFMFRFKNEPAKDFIMINNYQPPKPKSKKGKVENKTINSIVSTFSTDHCLKQTLSLINSIPRKRYVNNLLAMFEFPKLEEKTLNNFLFLETFYKYQQIANSKSCLPCKAKEPKDSISALQSLYFKSVDSYFNYVNPFIPLFTRQSFYSRNRSTFVLNAVWLSGISHLPKTPFISQVQKYLEYQVFSLFKSNFKKINFDSLQGMLVIALGLQSYPWVRSYLWICQSLSINIAYSLGLHLGSPPGLDSPIVLERKLAYTSIIHMGYVFDWSCDIPCLVSLQESRSFRSGFMNLVSDIYYIDLKTNPTHWSLSDYCTLITGESAYSQGEIFNQINILRSKIKNDRILPQQLFAEMDSLSAALKYNSVKYFKKLNKLKEISPPLFHYLIDRHAHLNKFRTFYGLHWLNSLVLYLRNNNSETQLASDQYLRKALDDASQAINYDILIGTDTYYLMRLGLVFQCLLFIIRHAHSHKDPEGLLEITHHGFRHFISMENSSWVGNQAGFALSLFYTICNYLHYHHPFAKTNPRIKECYKEYCEFLGGASRIPVPSTNSSKCNLDLWH